MSTLAARDAGLSQEDVLSKMQEILQRILQLETRDGLRPEARLREDLHVDSLGMVDLVIGVEETFGVRMRSDLNLLDRVRTIADAVALVEELRQGKRA